MTFRSRKLALGVVALAALPLATAAQAPISSSIQGESAAQIAVAAESAMKNVKSFHVEGVIAPLTMNLSLSATGGGGSITESGATLEIVVAKGTVYIKADAKSWDKLTGSKSIGNLVANKWIKAPASNSDFSDFADLTITKDFATQVFTGDKGLSVESRSKTIDGHSAVELTDGQGGSLYVAASGPSYVLRISGTGKSPGTLNFSDFGDAPLPAVPKNAISLPGS
jgi:hypothetical protein